MPWSNQSGGGGWKGGGGGPWGPRPGGPSQQPDLEEILRRGQDRIRQAIPGGGLGGPFMALAAVVLIALVGFFGFTVRVNPDELGVVLRFGKFVRQLPPGLNFRWPYPIEEVELPKVTRINRIEIGMRGSSEVRDASSTIRDVPEESLMLTGDENIVDVQFAVQYILKSPTDFLFKNRSPDDAVLQAAETAVREIVGKSSMDFVIFEGRAEVAARAHKLMQQILDRYGTGISISNVTMQNAQPPEQVQSAFDDAVKAGQDRERQKNEGQAYANDVIPKARGMASRLQQEAEGYRQRVIEQAEGDASRFRQIVVEYNKAPQVTRDRLYIEAMQQVMSNTTKVLIDQKGGNSLIYLPLDKIMQMSGTGPAEAAPKSGEPAPVQDPSTTRSREAFRTRERESR